jgi:hypothetical protein
MIPHAVEVKGSHTSKYKEVAASWFCGNDLSIDDVKTLRLDWSKINGDPRTEGKNTFLEWLGF